jgi:glycerol-3-phosphate acyltransferase PlsY
MLPALGRWRWLTTRKTALLDESIVVVLGYLLGSIPSAYIIGRLMGKIDVRQEGDGRISAAAVHKRLGVVPFVLVVIMDVGEGASAVLIAQLLTDSLVVVLIAGFMAVVGHNWSVFLKFKGGLGATTMYGALVVLVWWQVLLAAAIAFALFLIIRKSGLSTAILILVVSVILLVQYLFQNASLILVIYPFILILLMVLKRFQIGRVVPAKS